MPSRRAFLKTSALATAGAFAASGALSPFQRAAGMNARRNFTPIRRGVGTFELRGGTIGWLVRPDALVVVDSQYPDTAEILHQGLSERSDRRIDLLINSHHHGDHTAGNATLRPHVERVLAHRNVPELMRSRGTMDDAMIPDRTFGEVWEEDLGDETIRLTYHGPAHTGGDAVIHFVRADVVHMGDLVFNRMPCFVDVAGGADSAGWMDVLQRVHDDHTDDTIFIYGHGNPDAGITGTREDLLLFRDFLGAVRDHVQAGIRDGKSAEDLAVDRLPGFESFYHPDRPDGVSRTISMIFSELSGS
jgi:glyoxylase-like metal-dependent hydrolase (beta-lactamase superfamily II)